MASPAVIAQGTSNVTTAGTSHTVSIGSPASGTRVVVVFGYAVTGQTVTWPAGWTAVINAKTELVTDDTVGVDVGYRDCNGSEGATISVTTSVNTKSDHNYYQITGQDTGTAPEATTGLTGTDVNPDPPSLSPTGGSKDYLFVAAASSAGENTYSAFPTSYVNTQQSNTGTGGATNTNCFTATGTRAVTAASENPATFTRGLASGVGWVAQTIAVHPTGAAVTAPPRPTVIKFAAIRAATY